MSKLSKSAKLLLPASLFAAAVWLLVHYWPWVTDWYHAHSASEVWQTALFSSVVVVFLTVLTIIVPIWHSRRTERKKRSERPFPYEILSLPQLYERLGVPEDRRVKYIPRKQLVERWGSNLIPDASRIIFHGKSGVGKSREAIELIERISKRETYQTAYKQYEAALPSRRPPDLPRNNIVLFIDNLELEREVAIGQSGETAGTHMVVQELRDTVNFFKKEYHKLNIILTMQTPQFEALKSSSPELVEEFQVVELHTRADDRRTYAERLADRVACQPAAQTLYDLLIEHEDESLKYVYGFFNRLAEEGKKLFDAEDVRQYRAEYKEGSEKEFLRYLTEAQKSVLQALSCLRQFGIEAHKAIVRRLFLRTYPRESFFSRRGPQFDQALTHLSRSCLTISKNTNIISNSADFGLTLKSPGDPAIIRDLSLLTDAALDLARPRLRRSREIPIPETVELLNMITRRLNMFRQPPKRALEVASAARRLAPRDERALFQTGLTLMRTRERAEAEKWFRRVLEVDPGNKYVSHRMAVFYRGRKRYAEALRLLDEAVKRDPDDVLVLKLKLDVLRETGVWDKSAVAAYRQLRRTIRNGDADISQKLSAEFTCARFLTAYKRHLDKEPRRLEKAAERIRLLVEEISPGGKISAADCYDVGRSLYDQLSLPGPAIYFLQLALSYDSSYAYSAYKLYSIYRNEANAHAEQRQRYLEQAGSYIEKAIELDRRSYRWRLYRAQLQGELQDWDTLDQERYWDEARRVWLLFGEALRPEEKMDHALHNANVHHAAASFLWHVERIAHERGLERPASYQTAETEFHKSLELEALCGDNPPEGVLKHLALAYLNLGEYIMAIGGRDYQQRMRAREYVERSFELLRRGALDTGLTSDNSFIESHIGQLFLQSGDGSRAKHCAEKAIGLRENNYKAWWLLGEVAEHEQDFGVALSRYEKSADLQQSPHTYCKIWEARKRLVKAGLIASDTDEDLRLSSKAFGLDPEGTINPRSLIDYARDRYAKARADRENDPDRLSRIKDLLIKAARKCQGGDRDSEASYLLWSAGECVRLSKGSLDEGLKLYAESARIQHYENRVSWLCRKIVRLRPDEAVGCFISLVNDGVPEGQLLDELAVYCENLKSTLPVSVVEALELLIDKYHENANHSKLKAFVNYQKRLKADKVYN